MWISILNYAGGRMEVADLAEYAEDMEEADNETTAKSWLKENGYNEDEIGYMITDDVPEIYDHNTQNVVDVVL